MWLDLTLTQYSRAKPYANCPLWFIIHAVKQMKLASYNVKNSTLTVTTETRPFTSIERHNKAEASSGLNFIEQGRVTQKKILSTIFNTTSTYIIADGHLY